LEIRAAKETDLAELVELQCLVFRPNEEGAQHRYWSYLREEPTFELDQARIVVDQGRIVANLRVWDRLIRVRGAQLRVGGIGGVLTHPDFRRRGHARALMQDADIYMQRAGYDLGMLFTIIGTPYYAGLGWTPISLPTFVFKLDHLKQIPGEMGRDLDPERDLSAIMALNDACGDGLTGTEVRSEAYWRSGPSRYRDLFPQKGIEREGKLVGYLNLSSTETDLAVREVCFLPGDEAACCDLARMLLMEAQRKEARTIKGSLPVDHPLVDQLIEASGAQPSRSQHEKTMVKLLNWKSLTAKLGGEVALAPPADEAAFWRTLFHQDSTTPAEGFFYWPPDMF
jgi:predicted acetyltransferase